MAAASIGSQQVPFNSSSGKDAIERKLKLAQNRMGYLEKSKSPTHTALVHYSLHWLPITFKVLVLI